MYETLKGSPEAEEVAMTIAEQLQVKGLARGLAKQMKLKFGALSLDHEERIASATEAQLDVWLERILTAPTPEAVFDQ